ncbi:unnamed protein product, partial [Adineta steineri]
MIDCLGAYDERNFCRKKYPDDPYRRFRCHNTTDCISVKQLCDCKYDCEYGDDEKLCVWLDADECYENLFECIPKPTTQKAMTVYLTRDKQCNGIPECLEFAEDEWMCDLIDISPSLRPFSIQPFAEYQSPTRFTSSAVNSIDAAIVAWYCNRGVLVLARQDPRIRCFCPPSYKGASCELQQERVTYNDTIMAHETVTYIPDKNQCRPKLHIYLSKPRHNVAYNVRFDLFASSYDRISKPTYRTSWLYPVAFPFLPVNRLAVRLFLQVTISLGFSKAKCTYGCVHGTCMKFINSEQYYCACDEGWTGSACNQSTSFQCSRCHPQSTCLSYGNTSKCVCPLGKSGKKCYVTVNLCLTNRNLCLNGATCVALDRRTPSSFMCLCPLGFVGTRCEKLAGRLLFTFAIEIPSVMLLYTVTQSNDTISENWEKEVIRLPVYKRQVELYLSTEFIPERIFLENLDDGSLHLLLLTHNNTMRE